uniref:Uncharacterized protein n=1 Tax=Magallana gigas TaxID=29159 RepID=A0A8W8J6U5_MAGGI
MDGVPLKFDIPINNIITNAHGASSVTIQTMGHGKASFTVVLGCTASGKRIPLMQLKSLLVLDSMQAYISDITKQWISAIGSVPAVIPGILTKLLQPLDISVNQCFKAELRVIWENWMTMGASRQWGNVQHHLPVKAPCPQYHMRLPGWLSLYTMVHFTLELLYFQEVAARRAGFSQLSVLLFVLHIGFCLTCFGKIFDNDPSAPKYEVVRCLMTLAGDVALCHYGFYGAPGYRPTFVTVLQALFTASLALWSFVIYQNAMKTKKLE